jgi:hypothetical protein
MLYPHKKKMAQPRERVGSGKPVLGNLGKLLSFRGLIAGAAERL